MIKFWYFPYSLTPRFSLNALSKDLSREGALFKMQWPDQKIGYADYFPWPEYNDESVNQTLANLKKGKISPLFEQTIWLARQDAGLRAGKKTPMADVKVIKNHYTITDINKINDDELNQKKAEGFTTLKVKVGRDLAAESDWLDRVLRKHAQLTVRLDFNSQGSLEIFEKFMAGIFSQLRPRIEYVEDPFPYDRAAWASAAKVGQLAMDMEYKKINWEQEVSFPFKVMVYKPARQDYRKIVELMTLNSELKLVVSSSMDHAVGVAHALRIAAELKRTFRNRVLECGCLTQGLYWPDDFIKSIETKGPVVTDIKGFGIGFDSILEALAWTPL